MILLKKKFSNNEALCNDIKDSNLSLAISSNMNTTISNVHRKSNIKRRLIESFISFIITFPLCYGIIIWIHQKADNAHFAETLTTILISADDSNASSMLNGIDNPILKKTKLIVRNDFNISIYSSQLSKDECLSYEKTYLDYYDQIHSLSKTFSINNVYILNKEQINGDMKELCQITNNTIDLKKL
jgi:hypothetical protein